MRLRLVPALLLAAGCAGAATPTPPVPPTGVPEPGVTAVEPAPIEAGRTPPPGPYAPGFDALRYYIALNLTEATASPPRIRAVARIDVALVAPRRDTLVLDFTGLRVLRVEVGIGAPGDDVEFRHDAGRLHVPVPAAAAVGDTLRVSVGYDGTPDDGLIIRDNVHGVRTAFADNWPDRARFWFPSIDHPSDKATVSFVVIAPPGWTVIANGPRDDADASAHPLDRPSDGRWRFTANEPIPTYTMVIGAGPLTETLLDECADGGRGCVPTRLYTFPPDSAKAQPSFARAADMIAYYSGLFAPFPYAKLDHAQSATRFGGMENVGAIFYSEEAIAQGRNIEGTVAHEIVHQWFGDAVTEADWQHLWLSEGFATYFGAQYFEHADGPDAFRERIAGVRAAYLDSDDVALPLVDTTATKVPDLFALLNTNSYQKGALVLHMLRGELGDSAFFDGVRRFYHARVHGTALTVDLRAAFERASGRDLRRFFDQWVYSPGHPVLRVTHDFDEASGEAVVTVEQVQSAEWPVFQFDTALRLVAGDDVLADVPVQVAERTTTVRVPVRAVPTGVVIDPAGHLLHALGER